MKISREAYNAIAEVLSDKPFAVRPRMLALLEKMEVVDIKETRTESQHNSLFLWFTMIEREAENAGITWDMIIRHTHQLRITKESLHGMCKQLQKALWGTESTKELNKNGHIDIIIDHFTELFSKEGLELPQFPFDANKNK